MCECTLETIMQCGPTEVALVALVVFFMVSAIVAGILMVRA